MDIRTKLSTELSQPITSERQVVYILVELRKLIELNGDGEAFSSLKLHCDWAAHPHLTGRAAQDIVRLFDKFQGMFDEMDEMRPDEVRPLDHRFMRELGPIMTLTSFRYELRQYLESQRLDSRIPMEDEWWINFVRYYASVIEDCPLKCVSQGLKHTDEVLLSAREVHPDLKKTTNFTIVVDWSWKAKRDGTIRRNRQFY